MEQVQIAVIGGDLRLKYLCNLLENEGYRVLRYGIVEKEETECHSLKDAVKNAEIVVTGIPFSKGEQLFAKIRKEDATVQHLYDEMNAQQILFGGCFAEEEIRLFQKKGITCIDFMKDETLAVFNAIATAEGAIAETLVRKKTNLQGSQCLVLGYGRCGKVIAHKLKGLEAEVTVCDRRRESLAYAKAFGHHTILPEELEKKIHRYAYVFNTIPKQVIGREILKKMPEDVLIIDIASKAGGVDDKAAKELGKKVYLSPGLPGKYAPLDSAKGLMEVIIRKGIEDGVKRN